MSHERDWQRDIPRDPNDLCWEVVELVRWMLPQPYNHATSVGFGLQRKRLARELREFEFLHRLKVGRPAGLDALLCAGMLILAVCKGKLPLESPEPLVNLESFDGLLKQIIATLIAVYLE